MHFRINNSIRRVLAAVLAALPLVSHAQIHTPSAGTPQSTAVIGVKATLLVEHPSSGVVHNTKETTLIAYSCRRSANELACEFVQTSIRQKSSEKNISALLGI
jgi:hypothetical protein